MIKWIVVVGVMAFAPLPAFGAQLTADSINAANFTGKVPSEERYQTSLPAGGPQSTARGGWRHESGPLPGRYGESVTIRSLAHSDGGNSWHRAVHRCRRPVAAPPSAPPPNHKLPDR